MGNPPMAADRTLGVIWLVTIVLLLMVRELYRPAATALVSVIWWTIGWVTILLVLLLAVLAVLRLVQAELTITGSLLAVLSVLYLPVHTALWFGFFGDVRRLFEFSSALQAVFYPAMTLLALLIILGIPGRRDGTNQPTG